MPARFAAVLLAAAGCAGTMAATAKEAAPARAVRVVGNTVELVGSIDAAMVEGFNRAVTNPRVDTVVIESASGDDMQGLRIANAMRARNMNVVVRGLCAGTCAQLIFIAGRNRRIEDAALVIFANSVAGVAQLIERVRENVPADFLPTAEFRDFAAAEVRFYEQVGVAPSLFMQAQLAQQPRCMIFNRVEGKPTRINLSKTYAMWVPTRQQLEAAGVTFEGFWPGSRAEVLRVGAARLVSKKTPGQERYLRFGDEDHLLERNQVPYKFKELEACALEEENRPAPAGAVPAG